ncbi:MAG: hypothetical protein HY852_00885 [Bradyrhizobium sp.]|uniref:hypothetical protein n=1 Tax=Bradyrhizobium sp. TaxID=376 RepID=UPI0025C71C82|nr:hypothetical protein [Bradyrhizobium sp.]MBI5260355.1 hypothetical protein [Bradyrhizobium sp.]
MTAQIFQFRKYQKSRELARMQSDIERSLAKLNQIAADVFKALKIDTADHAPGTESSGK